MMSEEKTVVSRTAPIATLSWFEGEMRVVMNMTRIVEQNAHFFVNKLIEQRINVLTISKLRGNL